MKVLKYSKGSTTNNVIIEGGLKAGSLKDHVLVADNNFGESGSNEQLQTAIEEIKSSGIEYVIAPGFTEGFHKNAVAIGLHLIKCKEAEERDEEVMVNRVDSSAYERFDVVVKKSEM